MSALQRNASQEVESVTFTLSAAERTALTAAITRGDGWCYAKAQTLRALVRAGLVQDPHWSYWKTRGPSWGTITELGRAAAAEEES